MKHALTLPLIILSLTSCGSPASSSPSSLSSEEKTEISSLEPVLIEDYHPEGYSLTWSDEFDGNTLNLDNWDYQIGNNNGWGNQELQYYTDENEEVKDGLLTITAKREDITETVRDQTRTYGYTSSRLYTKGKKHFTYGYMCVRIRLPLGQGMWPAFWMMPETNYGNEGVSWWPTCGEIDIMEARGRIDNVVSGALHYSSDGIGGTHTYKTMECKDFGYIDEFHVYAVEWTEENITWYCDGESFFTLDSRIWNAGYKTGDNAPFNRDFYFILNLAVGGQFDGGKRPAPDFQQAQMDVDYVRCYQR